MASWINLARSRSSTLVSNHKVGSGSVAADSRAVLRSSRRAQSIARRWIVANTSAGAGGPLLPFRSRCFDNRFLHEILRVRFGTRLLPREKPKL